LSEIELQTRVCDLRCALCLEPAAPAKTRACPKCSAVVHEACASEFPACPTLGCEVTFRQDIGRAWGRVLLPATAVAVGFGLIAAGQGGPGVVLACGSTIVLGVLNFRRPAPSSQHLLGLGEVYRERYNAPRALECFDRALSLRPDDLACLHAKGQALLGLERWEEARACYDRVLELEPGDAAALVLRATSWRSVFDDARAQADFARGEDLLLEGLKADKGDPNSWELLATSRWDRDLAGALAAVEAGLRVAADATRLLSQRGHFRFLAGAYDLAERDLSTVLEEEADPWSSLVRAQVRVQLADFQGARSDMDLALRNWSSWTRLAGAMVLALCGDRRAAEVLLRRPVAAAAPDPYVYIWLRCLGFEASPPDYLGRKQWPSPIVEYLEGGVDEEALQELAAAHSAGRHATQGHQREALWCIGARAELDGDLERARRRFEEVSDLGHGGWINWEYANARLQVLGSSRAD